MPTSPEAASVVERLTGELAEVEKRAECFQVGRITGSDLRALLAVVEAATEALEYLKVSEPDAAEVLLRDPLDALYKP